MITFFLFSALLLIFATGAVLRKDTLESSILFLCAAFCASALFILSKAEFLAASAIVSYTALTIIIFLFTFLSMDTKERRRKRSLLPFGIITAIAFLTETVLLFVSFIPKEGCSLCKLSLTLSARDYPMLNKDNAWELSYLLFSNLWFLVIITGIILFLIMLCVMSVSTAKTADTEEK